MQGVGADRSLDTNYPKVKINSAEPEDDKPLIRVPSDRIYKEYPPANYVHKVCIENFGDRNTTQGTLSRSDSSSGNSGKNSKPSYTDLGTDPTEASNIVHKTFRTERSPSPLTRSDSSSEKSFISGDSKHTANDSKSNPTETHPHTIKRTLRSRGHSSSPRLNADLSSSDDQKKTHRNSHSRTQLIPTSEHSRSPSPKKIHVHNPSLMQETQQARLKAAKVRSEFKIKILELVKSFEILNNPPIYTNTNLNVKRNEHESSYNVYGESPFGFILSVLCEGIFEVMDHNGQIFEVEKLFNMISKKVDDTNPHRPGQIRKKIAEHVDSNSPRRKISNPESTGVFVAENFNLPENTSKEVRFIAELLLKIEPLKENCIPNNEKFPHISFFMLFCYLKKEFYNPSQKKDGTPVPPPETISLETLFNLIEIIIRHNNVKTIVKKRNLTLCGTLHKSNMFEDEIHLPKTKSAFSKIVDACNKLYEVNKNDESFEIRNLCDEIELIYQEPKSNPFGSDYKPSLVNQSLKSVDFIHSFIFGKLDSSNKHNPFDKPDQNEYTSFLDKVTKDLITDAALVFNKISPNNFSEKKLNNHHEAGDYTNQISDFVKNAYEEIITKAKEHKRLVTNESKSKIFKKMIPSNASTEIDPEELDQIKLKFIRIFTDLAYTLYQKHDYFICCFIHTTIYSMFLCVEPNKPNIHLINDKKNQGMQETVLKFNALSKMFVEKNRFAILQAEYDTCRWNRWPFIPNFFTMTSIGVRYSNAIKDGKKSTLEDSEATMIDESAHSEKLLNNDEIFYYSESNTIEQINNLLEDSVRLYVKTYLDKPEIETDIHYNIFKKNTSAMKTKSEESLEDKPDAISKRNSADIKVERGRSLTQGGKES